MAEIEELRKTVAKLNDVDTHRAELVQYRDRQMRELKEAGTTWEALKEATGLSLRGAQLSVDRAKSQGD